MRILETKRLYLREMLESDAESVYNLNKDTEVIKYTGDSQFKDIKDAGEFLIEYDHYKKYGFGRWAVIQKSDGAFLGWCGMKYTPELKEYDIGFRFHKKYWGNGFATESALSCLEWAFQNIDTNEIVGRAMPQNVASCKVLEKIGLKYYETRKEDNNDLLVYKIDKSK